MINMKYLFLDSINFDVKLAIVPAIPKLLGILEKEGIKSEYKSINFQYFKNLLTKESTNKFISFFQDLLKNPEFVESLDYEEKIFYTDSIKTLKNWLYISDFCLAITKNKKYFYNRILLEFAQKKIFCVSNIFKYFLKKKSFEIFDFDFINYNISINIDKLLDYFNSEAMFHLNTFTDSFIEDILGRKNEVPKCIGISINVEPDLLYGLFIAYKLKQKTNIHVNIGGSLFNTYNIENIESLFDLFFDSVSVKDNTKTVVELYNYLENKLSIEDVSNIIYKKEGKIIKNISSTKQSFLELPCFEFNGYNPNDYFNCEFVLPLQISTSCYWKKCIFCIENSSESYKIKPVEDVVKEIEYLSKKYNTKFFTFWDSAIHPNYLKELSKQLIEKKLDISYSIYARLEKEFDIKLLKQMKKSGCFCIYWGLDSCSDRVLNYIKKGITTETQSKVLKASYKAGIFNSTYLILGHPTETKEELEENIKFLKAHKKYIDVLNTISSVVFLNGSTITKDRQKYEKLINFTKEELISYKKKINKLAVHQYYDIPISGSSFIVSYIRKYRISLIRILFRLFVYTGKFPPITNFYIRLEAIKYYIKNKSSLNEIKKLLSVI